MKKLEEIMNNKKACRIFGILMAAFVILCYVILMSHNGYRYLNSDDSSELLLSRILASQHALLTPDYYYSTQLNVLNTQLVFAPLFLIFDSWSMVRIVGGVIILILYAASYIVIPYGWDHDPSWFYLTAFILLMPFADPWMYFGMKMYYLPYVSISFLSFALLGAVYSSSSKKKTVLWAVLSALLAFAAGLGGTRSLELTYAPLLLTAFIMMFRKGEKKKAFIVSLISSLCAFGGYLINDGVLSKIYHFRSYGNVSFIAFSVKKMEWMIGSVLESFGYVIGEYFMSFGGVLNVLALLMCVGFFASFFVIYGRRRELTPIGEYMYWFAALTFIINTVVTTLGQNDEYASRYIAIGMVLCIFFPELLCSIRAKSGREKALFRAVLVICFLIIGAGGYLRLLHTSGNGNRLGYIKYLEENGYSTGYATFWNANITTEMTDGKLGVISLDPNKERPELYRWQTDRRLIEEAPERSYLVLSAAEENMYQGSEPVYRDDSFLVFDITPGEIYDPGE